MKQAVMHSRPYARAPRGSSRRWLAAVGLLGAWAVVSTTALHAAGDPRPGRKTANAAPGDSAPATANAQSDPSGQLKSGTQVGPVAVGQPDLPGPGASNKNPAPAPSSSGREVRPAFSREYTGSVAPMAGLRATRTRNIGDLSEKTAAGIALQASPLTEIVPPPGEWADARRAGGALGALAPAARAAPAPAPGACVEVATRPDPGRTERVRVDFAGDGLIHTVLARADVRQALAGTRHATADLSEPQVLCVPQALMRRLAQLGAPAARGAATKLKRDNAAWVLAAPGQAKDDGPSAAPSHEGGASGAKAGRR